MKIKLLASIFLCAMLAAPAAFGGAGIGSFLKILKKTRDIDALLFLNRDQISAINSIERNHITTRLYTYGNRAPTIASIHELLVVKHKLNLRQLEAIRHLNNNKEIDPVFSLDKSMLDEVIELVKGTEVND